MRFTDSSKRMINSSSLNSNTDEILHVLYDYTSKEDDELTLKYENHVKGKDKYVLFLKTWKYIRSIIKG